MACTNSLSSHDRTRAVFSPSGGALRSPIYARVSGRHPSVVLHSARIRELTHRFSRANESFARTDAPLAYYTASPSAQTPPRCAHRVDSARFHPVPVVPLVRRAPPCRDDHARRRSRDSAVGAGVVRTHAFGRACVRTVERLRDARACE